MSLEKGLQHNQLKQVHLIWQLVFSFVLIISAAYGMKILETAATEPAKLKESFGILIAQAAETPNKAELTEQSHTLVNIKPGDAFTFTLKFKNNGTTTWTKEKVYLKSTPSALKFSHPYWPDPYLPAQLSEAAVLPGETGTFKFALQPPPNFNLYDGDFLLVNDNVMIKGGDAKVAMNVVADPSTIKTVATNNPPAETSPETKKNICTLKLKSGLQIATYEELDNITCAETLNLPESGPDVTVGVFHTTKPLIISNSETWQVYDENDTLLASVPANTPITFYYITTKKEYAFDFIDKTIYSATSLKLHNFNQGIFVAENHEDRPSWNKSINYNRYQGDLLIKYNTNKERVWLIEKLPLEKYLLGIKETSDTDPVEYLKTMTVAARTYALYHVNKYHGENAFFDLYSDENDQVYKGYSSAAVMPNLTAAVTATSGIIASYEDEIIIAFYSAISGGQTLDHKTLPYLRAVETSYTSSLDKWGHGLGIDAYNARAQAREENLTYDQLLKYYYTGIDLEKIY